MTPRDPLVVSALAALALVAGAWCLIVSPKQKEASDAGVALSAEQSALSTARQQLLQARVAAQSYPTNLRTVRQDFRAVPSSDAFNRLLPMLQHAAQLQHVDFRVIAVAAPGTPAATPAPGGPAPAATRAPGSPGATAGGFTATSFTLTFDGGYRRLQSFLHAVDRFVEVRRDFSLVARHRLLVINSVALKPQAPAHGNARAAISATAYSQPAAGGAGGAQATVPPLAAPNGAVPAPAAPAAPSQTTTVAPAAGVTR
ncbi:MAG: hypothetical protein NVS1B9_09570 [Solirubrobacteraceae bacterium]